MDAPEQRDEHSPSDGSQQWFAMCADRLKVIADPHRLQIIEVLFTGPKFVGDIAIAVGEPIVRVSHHLSVMRAMKLVIDKKQGRFVEYSLHPDVFVPASAEATERVLNLGCCCFIVPPPTPG